MKNNIYLKALLNIVVYSAIIVSLLYLQETKSDEGSKSKTKFVYQQF